MRNKKKFLEDFSTVVDPNSIMSEVDPVEDAAHIMNQTGELSYVVSGEFTKHNEPVSFNFHIIDRDRTSEEQGTIQDYEYVGMGQSVKESD